MRRILPILLAVGVAVGSLAAYELLPAGLRAYWHAPVRAADLDAPSALTTAVNSEVASPRASLATGASSKAAPSPERTRVLFAAPALPSMRPLPRGAPVELPDGERLHSDDLRASAYYFISRVYWRPSTRASARALVRRGHILDVTDRVRGQGCDGGHWYKVAPEGYVCSHHAGFRIRDWNERFGYRTDAPDVDRGLPYRYGKLIDQGAPRLDRVPSAAEWARIEEVREKVKSGRRRHERDYPDVVRKPLHGAYFFALASEEHTDSGKWLHTVRGRVLPKDAVERLGPTRMQGEHLREGRAVAFVVEEEAPVLSVDDLTPVGVAERYGRFEVQGELERDGVRYVRALDGPLVARDHVRRVRVVERPEDVPQDARWIHVDLPEQVLVAYEGDTPVFATLIASGIEGHETPSGLFRVRERHISATMRGPDPDMGVYEVEEVPWTQYFDGSYALHGAYWHDAFGAVRSHGCVNIPPEDARWLFDWSGPDMPESWHSMRRLEDGVWVYVTG